MDHHAQLSDDVQAHVRALEAAARGRLPAHAVFRRLHDALVEVVGFNVLTVLKLDPTILRSVRLYSSEPSYPVGGTKQHVRSAWSEAVLERKTVFLAPDLAAVRSAFPDSAAIEVTGCGSIVAAPIIHDGAVVGTLNLWHREGYFDAAKARLAMPFADAIARVVHDADPTTYR
jgi:hypothetical protein